VIASAEVYPDYLLGVGGFTAPIDNNGPNATYENYAARTVVLVLQAWLKNTTEGAVPDPWGDARTVCARPRDFTVGSRLMTSGASAARGSEWGVEVC
jgi:hypothetical protein